MQETRFMRAAAFIGDLGSPFYREERQRDVWNEASAVGFQTMLWLSYAVGSVSLWVGGRAAVPYAVATVMIAVVASLITLAYSRNLGVEMASRKWLTTSRLVAFALLYLSFVGGLTRALWSVGGDSFRHGFPVGVVVGLGLAVAVAVRAMRNAERAEDDEAPVAGRGGADPAQ